MMAQLKLYHIFFLVNLYFISICECNTSEEACQIDLTKLKSENRSCADSCATFHCKNPSKKCICDGPCGLVCIPPGLQCSRWLKIPAHGTVKMPKGNKFNELIYYACEDGFELIGERKRICQSNGEWIGSEPFCTRKGVRCAKPEFELKNVDNTLDTTRDEYYLGDEITFKCKFGYRTTENSILTTHCEWSNQEDYSLSDGRTSYWTPITANCTPVVCKKPENIENGYYEGNNFIFGSRIKFFCNKDYYLHGANSSFCLVEGLWSNKPPTCKNSLDVSEEDEETVLEPVLKQEFDDDKCACIQEPIITTTPLSTTVGTKKPIYLKCRRGVFSNMDAFLEEKKLTRDQLDFEHLSVITFRCSTLKGFAFDGKPSSTCYNGKWQPGWPNCRELVRYQENSYQSIDLKTSVPWERLNYGDYWLPTRNAGLRFICHHKIKTIPVMKLNWDNVDDTTVAKVDYNYRELGWMVKPHLSKNETSVTFRCKSTTYSYINEVTVHFEYQCMLNEEDILKRYHAYVVPLSRRFPFYVEGDVVLLQCGAASIKHIPESIDCYEGNWISNGWKKCF